MNTQAIATHLNIVDSAIIEIQEWASVLWVKFTGGVRFVSKKIGAAKMKLTVEKQSQVKWVCRSETPTSNKYFPAQAWIAISRDGIVSESKQAVGTDAPTEELRSFALAQVAALKRVEVTATAAKAECGSTKPYRRTSCLNCGITNTILMGRGYCTDCHGEC
jgi:hypothetical protein